MKVIVNADDFGFSKGVNLAILESFKDGRLNSASIGVTSQYFSDAARVYKDILLDCGKFFIGLHFNLTSGQSALHPISIPLLVDCDGNFKNSFLDLFLLSINPLKRFQFLSQVKIELQAQLNLLEVNGIKIDHIDGHRHVHFIPAIFKIVSSFAKKKNISRVRVINENIFNTLKATKSITFAGFAKWAVLRFFSLFNEKSNYYFYSVIHSCKMKQEYLDNFKIPIGYENLEIMIHPGNSQIDSKDENLKCECEHLSNEFRDVEKELIFKKF